jgi:hypothetical protein
MNPLDILALFAAFQNLALGQNRFKTDLSARFFEDDVWNGMETTSSICSPLDQILVSVIYLMKMTSKMF